MTRDYRNTSILNDEYLQGLKRCLAYWYAVLFFLNSEDKTYLCIRWSSTIFLALCITNKRCNGKIIQGIAEGSGFILSY